MFSEKKENLSRKRFIFKNLEISPLERVLHVQRLMNKPIKGCAFHGCKALDSVQDRFSVGSANGAIKYY